MSCVDYLLKMRWPEGFACPRCGAKGSPYQLSRKCMMLLAILLCHCPAAPP
ncbi:transposase [Arsukibacterium ikkense]|uniref:transposase n=1 Tax=Arsukibacterium ikkense TaxID=336831 RepID=UPI003898FD7D